MLKKFLIGLCFLIGCLIGYLAIRVTEDNERRPPSHRRSLDATCMIKTGGGVGTGILLDTGYILTAAHVVDRDYNQKLSSEERDVDLYFDQNIKYAGRVLYYNFENDFALIEPADPISSYDSVDVAANISKHADSVYTIGCSNGAPQIISEGRIARSHKGTSRASCYVAKGNSGGGLFNENHQVIGIIVGVGYRRILETTTITIPTSSGFRIVYMQRSRIKYLNGLCYFKNIDEIRENLKKIRLDSLIDKPEGPTFYERISNPWVIATIRIILNITVLFVFLAYFRRQILS